MASLWLSYDFPMPSYENGIIITRNLTIAPELLPLGKEACPNSGQNERKAEVASPRTVGLDVAYLPIEKKGDLPFTNTIRYNLTGEFENYNCKLGLKNSPLFAPACLAREYQLPSTP